MFQEIVYFTAAVSVIITRIALITLFGYCCQKKTAALVLCQLQRQDQSCKMSIFYTDISVISLTLCQLQRQDRHQEEERLTAVSLWNIIPSLDLAEPAWYELEKGLRADLNV